MSIYFSSGRSQFPEDVWCFTVIPNTGTLTAGDYYFTVQGRNRIGVNLPLVSNLISVPDNSSLVITLKDNIHKSGENWFDIVLSISTTTNAVDFKQFLCVNLKDTDDGYWSPFPLDIILNKDSDLQTEIEYCNINDIDDTDFQNGKIIKLTSTTFLYEFYKSLFIDEEDIDASQFNTTLGSFKQIFSSNRYIANIQDYGGCNLNIRSDLAALDYYRYLEYTIDGTNSPVLRFTISNTTYNALPAGALIYIESYLNNGDANSYLQNSIFVTYIGFVNLTTGVLRTTDYYGNTITALNEIQSYDTQASNLYLPDDLNPNEGFVLDISINLNAISLSNVFTNDSQLLIYPDIYNSFVRYSPFYEIFTEGIIVNKPDYFSIQPLLDGNVLVKKGEIIFKGYSVLRNVEEEIIVANNEEQYLNLTNRGSLESYLLSETIPFNSINIARIKCIAGKSKISNKISIFLSSANSLNFKLNLDVENNLILVRNNYENKNLRNTRINFPTIDLEIYVKKPDTTIIKISKVINTLAEQEITLSTLPSTTIDEANINLDTDFGLINSPLLTVAESTGGLIPSGTYEIYCSFLYRGLEITDILDTLNLFDLNTLGSGNGQIEYSITSINSTANLTLDLQTNINYEITLIGDCVLENSNLFLEGSIINILFKQDEIGGRKLTFGDTWKFINSNSTISLFPESVSYLKGFVTKNGIYCTIIYPYIDSNSIFGDSFQLNNLVPLSNGLNPPPINEDLSQLLNNSQLLNTNQLNN